MTESDREFLFELNRDTMRDLVEAVWGWDDEFQARHFDERFEHHANWNIIQTGDHDIGMLHVLDRPDDIFLVTIRIASEWQRRGIGTSVIESVLGRASATGKPVTLQVLRLNTGAISLYQRLGFGFTSETTTHLRMSAEPESAPLDEKGSYPAVQLDRP